jgi:AraC-like DNA-binding protein
MTVLWQRRASISSSERLRILPDGCLDVIWDGSTLSVAGPDAVARWHDEPPGQQYAALRLAGGTGPALVGVAADELVGRSVPLDQLWSAATTRRLTEAVAEHPAETLRGWVEASTALRDQDPVAGRILALARRQMPMARMADELGLGVRQLHRRSSAAFGYGPRRLSRILRLQQAFDRMRAGSPLAAVAADAGYADQAHLSRDVRALTGDSPGVLVRELTTR